MAAFITADRINVVEGMVNDLVRGRLPRFAAEAGWGAIWKHKPWLLVPKIAVRLSALAAIGAFFVYRAKKSNS